MKKWQCWWRLVDEPTYWSPSDHLFNDQADAERFIDLHTANPDCVHEGVALPQGQTPLKLPNARKRGRK